MSDILQVKHLSLAYGDKSVINDLSFNVEQGSFFSVLGENGVGKTTLIRAILGDLTPKSGEINLLPDNQSVKIGYVPQFRNIDDEYPLSIEEFVALNLTKRHTPWLSKAERDRVNAVIERTKLTTIAERPLGKASGGEKQRAYLAQALLQDPNLLILDESTASLDVDRKYELLDVVNQLNLSVLFITHDLPLVRHYADHFLLLQHGKYSVGTIDELPQIDGEAGVEHV